MDWEEIKEIARGTTKDALICQALVGLWKEQKRIIRSVNERATKIKTIEQKGKIK